MFDLFRNKSESKTTIIEKIIYVYPNSTTSTNTTAATAATTATISTSLHISDKNPDESVEQLSTNFPEKPIPGTTTEFVEHVIVGTP